ncbi:MAG: peroxide stress protein YaaA [Bifidobacterium mongoliense]|uniref:YaaA family protein n=1 Tax=Bifidobacterium mongoliense TaxID=518643 RepID=UPI002F35A344
MHILLPPSEGKTAPVSGPALDLDALSFPQFGAARRRVLEALIEASSRSDARDLLRVGARIMSEVRAQSSDLLSRPCAPARELYTGVLYDAAKLHAGDDVLIFSGLFGVTTGEDLIPDYRLPIGATLPGLGSVKSFWRREFARWWPAGDVTAGVTVDMRSQAYAVTVPQGPWWDVSITDPHGRVISHMAKHYRGLLTRALLDAESCVEARSHGESQPHDGPRSHGESQPHDGPRALARSYGDSHGDSADQSARGVASTYWSVGDVAGERRLVSDVAKIARSLGRVDVVEDGLCHHLTLTPFGR